MHALQQADKRMHCSKQIKRLHALQQAFIHVDALQQADKMYELQQADKTYAFIAASRHTC